MNTKFIPYFALVVGCLSLANVANASPSYKSSEFVAITDQDLAKKIHDKIGEGYFSKGFDQVNVQVEKGAVTLTGSVKTFADKEKVEKEVRNIDGVRELKSKITVQEPESNVKTREFAQDTFATSADDQLNKKIRDKVSKGLLYDSYTEVTLNTTNGVVTLEGFVEKIGDQQNLMKEIQKVDGVKSVKSDLKIKNPEK